MRNLCVMDQHFWFLKMERNKISLKSIGQTSAAGQNPMRQGIERTLVLWYISRKA